MFSSSAASTPAASSAGKMSTDSSAVSAETAVANTRPAARRESDIKETIESILIAFILAFIFRAFIVEAFVIPTGSMAPTLLGAHMRYTCPDCGYTFDVNFPTDSDDESMFVPKVARIDRPDGTTIDRVFAVNCPNCGFKIPRHDLDDPGNGASGPPVHYGDRILVLKYLYLFQDPKRWDVVVFKAPVAPIKDDYSVNYIKRLTGKPGESVMILDGDIYIAPPGSTGTKASDFTIQTKPRDVQNALWRVIDDNDFHPRGLSRSVLDANGDVIRDEPAWVQPWKPAAGGRGWDLSQGNGRAFRFDAADGMGAIQFDSEVQKNKFAFKDWLAYDQISSRGEYPADLFDSPDPQNPESTVNDLKLAFTYRRESGGGALSASMSKLSRTFIVRLEADRVVLQGRQNDIVSELGAVPMALSGGEHRVELTNVDYQVTVRIDGRDVIQTTPAQYSPDVPALLQAFERKQLSPKPVVRIEGEGQTCTLTHVGIWRDIYYGNRSPRADVFHGTPENFPASIMHLGPDEYFVLGDNSWISGDARYWNEPIDLPAEDLHVEDGRVPGRFLLGKAFFVYWPAGYRPFESMPALVPNFGDMRIIH